MLCQFTFKNFKSFRNEATLDLCAENIGEHSETLLVDEYDGEKFLPVVSIYGPNGSGKSSVLDAFSFLRYKVLAPIVTLTYEEIQDDESNKIQFLNEIESITDSSKSFFKFSPECKDLPTEFTIISRISNYEYYYYISILNNVIIEENFYRTNIINSDIELIFERSISDEDVAYNLGDVLNGASVNKAKKNLPLLSYVAISVDIEPIDTFVGWLMHCRTLNYNNYVEELPTSIAFLDTDKAQTLRFLKDMDINISDFRIERDNDGKITDVYTVHALDDGTYSDLNIIEESSGTCKILSILPHIFMSFRSGAVIIADEMDAKLHPKLFGYIISLFTDPKINKNQAQLICTSHDLYNMNKERFRRDEIWFCSMNAKNESTLYSLVQFKMPNGTKPRNDGSYSKQYIEGKFGADPYIRKGLEWEDINE